MRLRWLAIPALALLAGGVAWWLLRGPQSVTVVAATRGPAVDAIYATGTVEPTVMLPVGPRVAGRIIELRTDEGRRVHKGEVLARLDTADLDATLEELRARARYARAEFDRTAALVQRGVAAANELDRTRADLDGANAALKRAGAQRDFMLLTAPADGEVIRRDGEVGQYLAVGQALFYLACCAPLRVSADVDEEDIPRVRVGQKVVLRADALPGRSFDGEVNDVTPKGDPVARTYRVRVRLTDPEQFRIGMTVDANLIVAERQDALLVPTSAVIKGAVWVVREGHLAHQAVQLGVTGALRTEILGGLEDGARVVANPGAALIEGRAARVLAAATAVAPPGAAH